MQSEENKRKGDFLQHIDGPEKIRKTSSKFVDTLIEQWSKRSGMQIPYIDECAPTVNEKEHVQSSQDLKLQIIQKKLQDAEDAIAKLSSDLETELTVKDEITEKLNSTWESIDTITNYCNYMSESMKAYQEHINHLSMLYNTILDTQKNTVEQQERQLTNIKIKDAEQKKYIADIEENLMKHEKKIQELIAIKQALEQEVRSSEEKLTFEKNYLISLHTEEKLKLIKENEMTIIEKDKLQLSIKQMEEEKNKVIDLITKKELSINKLQEKMNFNETQIAELSSQNDELNKKIRVIEEEKGRELQEKSQEMQKLLEMLNVSKNRENELTNDIVEKIELYKNSENKLLETKKKLEKAENTIELLKNNESTTIIKLNKAIESLQKEKAEMSSQYQSQIQHIKQSQKNLQEKQEIALKEEFKTNSIEMKKTIEQLQQDIKELNEALTETKAENSVLQNKIYEIKENNNKSQKSDSRNVSIDKEKTQFESELEDKYVKHQKELALAEQKYKSVQIKLDKKLESQDILQTWYRRSQSLSVDKLENTSNNEDCLGELKKISSQKTPTQIFSAAENKNRNMETDMSGGEKKFFKLRSTQVRRYENRKNKTLRT